jgi:predicted PurR-regulated permease PerM
MVDKNTSEKDEPTPNAEPQNPLRWSGTTKLVVSLALIAILLWFLAKFQTYFSLILISLVFTILLRPLVKWLNEHLKVKWGIAAVIAYVVVALVMLGVLAGGGIALFSQLQNLISLLSNLVNNLITTLSQWSNRVIMLGPFSFQVPELTTKYLSDLLIGQVQPLLGRAGGLITKAISGGANLVFRVFMMYLISFFITAESNRAENLTSITLKGYEQDIQRMNQEISKIWSAFLRGQFLVVFTAFVIYSIFLSIMGLPFSLGLAIVIALGRFVPYIGAWIGWITTGVVALILQPTPFGLAPLAFVGIIIGFALVIDSFLDNILTPKVMGNALRVHPAAVLIMVLIGSQLFGLLGIMLAAPFLATIQLLLHYVLSKLTDQDPWQGITYQEQKKENFLTKWFRKAGKTISGWAKKVWQPVQTRLKQGLAGIGRHEE